MRVNRAQTFTGVAGIALLWSTDQAQPANAPISDKELIVATKESPPFVMKRSDGTLHGISIDLWHRIADRLHLRYRFSVQPTVEALVAGTAEGSFDAAIAALTVTAARDQIVDYHSTFLFYRLGHCRIQKRKRLDVRIACSLILSLFSGRAGASRHRHVGRIWDLAPGTGQHRAFQGGAKGLGTSLWWSAIAMTQAGAAQNAPATLPGRIVAIGWMIASVIVIAVFTAGITSTLTKRELQGAVNSVNDLRSVRVGAPAGSTSTDYLDREQIPHRGSVDRRTGLKALQTRAIDAFVYDKPLLTWLVLRDFSSTLRILDTTFESQNYAIALPKGSALRELIDRPLLEETESDWWQQTLFEYLGKTEPSYGSRHLP